MADLKGINAKIIERDVINAKVSSVIQRVEYETEEVVVNPSTETQIVMRSPEKYIEKVIANPVTATIDPDIQAENIKEGINILGVEGSYIGTDTRDATATAEDLIKDKTAYVNGEKITGTLVPEELTITPTEEEQTFTGFFNKVTCEKLENSVKLFTTEGEMKTDTNGKEENLAVVYREEIDNMTANTETQLITFPPTVVLPEAFTSNVYGMFRTTDDSVFFDAQVMLSSSNFEFSGYGESESILVTYESTDGITYIRTDSNGETIDCGVPIKCYYEDEWNDSFGHFMQCVNKYFGGLFEFKDTSWKIAKNQLKVTSEDVYIVDFYGSNGLETGTLQNTENLSKEQLVLRCEIWNNFNNLKINDISMMSYFSGFTGKQLPNLDTSNVQNMTNAFFESKLEELPIMDTSQVTGIMNFCAYSPNLVTLPLYDFSKVTIMTNMVNGCPNLSNESLNNVLAMCANSAVPAVGIHRTLKNTGLTSEQATICTGLSNYQAFINAGWKTGY